MVNHLWGGDTLSDDAAALPGSDGGEPQITAQPPTALGDASEGAHPYKWMRFPAGGGVAFAWGLEGDDFPRVVLPSDPLDALVYFGDGTSEPTDGGTYLLGTSNGGMRVRTPYGALNLDDGGAGLSVVAGAASTPVIVYDAGFSVLFQVDADGHPILYSPNGTGYRLLVANDGTLSTEAI